MEVQNFIIEQAESLIYDGDDLEKWKDQVATLGLEGQESLIDNGESPCVFERMTKEEEAVYKAAFPQKTGVTSYSGSVIPVEVLSLIALCEKEQYFTAIEIWHDDNDPDPLVVGCRGDYSRELYKIALFGETLKTFDQLKKKAREQMKVNLKRSLAEVKAEVQKAESSLDALIESRLLGERETIYLPNL